MIIENDDGSETVRRGGKTIVRQPVKEEMQVNTFVLSDGRQLTVAITEYPDGLVSVEAFAVCEADDDLTLMSAYFPKASWCVQ